MLSPTQKKKLVLRDRESPAERAKYDYIIASKLKKTLDDLADIEIVLTRLPKHKLQKYITDRHVATLLKASELMMSKLDYQKIKVSEDGETLYVYKEGKDGYREATPTMLDIKRTIALNEHAFALRAFYVPPTTKEPMPYEILESLGYKKPDRPASRSDMWDNAIRATGQKRRKEEPPK
jgi:hypothetical protein